MARSTFPLRTSKLYASKTSPYDARAKRHAKIRSSVASELIQRAGAKQHKDTEKRRIPHPTSYRSPRSGRVQGSNTNSAQYLASGIHRERQPQDGTGEPYASPLRSGGLTSYDALCEDPSDDSVSEGDESNESENEEDWMNGSTLIAKYQDEGSETEDDRVMALVESLQVPMQEKSQDIKQELCDLLIDTITEIRHTQQKLERGANVDRGKGIITFNDACDKRHIDTSRARAELKDSMADNQAEINTLFVQLKQTYARRDKLWADLRQRVGEITAKVQAEIIDQLDDNMERTVVALEKKGKALLKEDSGKNKEKLLRGVLGKF